MMAAVRVLERDMIFAHSYNLFQFKAEYLKGLHYIGHIKRENYMIIISMDSFKVIILPGPVESIRRNKKYAFQFNLH